jgi:adenosine deaminase
MNEFETLVRSMPKVELHLHIEGAIPLQTLFRLIRRSGREPSIKTVEDLSDKLRYTSFEHFIELWTWKNTFIRDESDFEDIAYTVLRDLNEQNVKYVEATYSPGDYRRKGLATGAITACIIAGKERAYRDFGIRCELIVDLIRDHGPEIGVQRLDEVTPYLGRGVVGIGLGGSEQMFPAGPYEPVYAEARERGFRLTAHAGEVAGAESIWAVITKLGVERIGHGLRAFEDPKLMDYLERNQLPLEMCVISNLRTGVWQSIGSHPIRQYFDRGLKVTVNSDDPAMFSTSITDEYEALATQLGFTASEIKHVSLNAIDASFAAETDRASLRRSFEDWWCDLEL